MNRHTLRLILILATLSIVGITVTQVYWVRRAFDLKQDAWNREINTALFNVAQQIFKINKMVVPEVNPVKQVSTNYFVVMVNGEIDVSLLEFLLRSEFDKRNIAFDFEYGIYNCDSEQMVYGNYIAMEKKSKEQKGSLAKWKGEPYYFGVQFPTRESHLLNQMGIWSFSTLVLLLVIVFFAYTLFIIFKQRRLGEIQKDFINNMTHEFKTPISTIAISAEVLKDPKTVSQPERLLNYATIIQNENNRLRLQVDRVLQAARLDKEDIGLKREINDFKIIVQEAVANMEIPLKEREGKISIETEAAQTNILGDKLNLTNVLNNLIDNAIKYCEGKPYIHIKLSNRVLQTRKWFKVFSKPSLEISITDNGIGLTQENQKRIFQKFFRVPTGNIHNVKGFGIGLFYVKLIIEAHHGSLFVKSEEHKGSTFTLSIPLA